MAKWTREEKKLLKSFEQGEFRSVPNLSREIARHQRVARTTLKKNMRVNIRLASFDVEGMKRKAFQEGIPYQTLMSSIIHKYVVGKLVEKAA